MLSIVAVFPDFSASLRDARQRTKMYSLAELTLSGATIGRTASEAFGVGFYKFLSWETFEEKLAPALAGVAERIEATGRVGVLIEVSSSSDDVISRVYDVRESSLERLEAERGTEAIAVSDRLEDRVQTPVPESKGAFDRSLIERHGEFYDERECAHEMLQRYAHKQANPKFESINMDVFEDSMKREVGGAYLGHDDIVEALVDEDYRTTLELVADRQPRQQFAYDYEVVDG